ncbi:MAG: SRPBCC family protein [Marinilabiliaceae bacterium]|nr:SRPBCC family protein [Marinilabiliaceae bacterium]
MTSFQSSIQISHRSDSELFGLLSNFNSMEKVLPRDKLKNWQAENDSCSFFVDGLGEVGLKISGFETDRLVKYVGFGKIPFNFYLFVNLTPAVYEGTQVQVCVDAKLNPLVKMVASPQIKKFIETLVQSISAY